MTHGSRPLVAGSHFAVVFNNNDPRMKSQGVRIIGNTFEGMKFGGVFLIGQGQTIEDNTFTGNANGRIVRMDPATGKLTTFPMPDSSVRDPHPGRSSGSVVPGWWS